MCKLLVAINNQPTAPKQFKELIETQFNTLADQPDGIGALVIDQNNKVSVFREFEEYQLVFAKLIPLLDTAKFVSIHTRIGTSGSTALGNVHFFEANNFYMAHNGFVAKYAGNGYQSAIGFNSHYTNSPYMEGYYDNHYEETDGVILKPHWDTPLSNKTKKDKHFSACDSLKFLQNLPKNLTEKSLSDYIEKTGFVGMAVIVSKDGKEKWLIVKKEVKMMFDQNNFCSLFSYAPNRLMGQNIYKQAFSLPYIDKVEKVKIKLSEKTILHGVYKLS